MKSKLEIETKIKEAKDNERKEIYNKLKNILENAEFVIGSIKEEFFTFDYKFDVEILHPKSKSFTIKLQCCKCFKFFNQSFSEHWRPTIDWQPICFGCLAKSEPEEQEQETEVTTKSE